MNILDGFFVFLNEVVASIYHKMEAEGLLDTPVVVLLQEKTLGAVLALASRALKLKQIVTPHQLRHGGPSFDYATGALTLADIKSRGRWEADKTVRRYKKSGRINEQLQALDPDVLEYCLRSRDHIADVLMKRSPPLGVP